MEGKASAGASKDVIDADGRDARRAMQIGLLRSFLALVIVASAALTVRESLAHSPALAAVLALALGVGAGLWSWRGDAPVRLLGVAVFGALVLLITRAALDLGGAAGSALSFSFIPGFLAVLVLGPALGWAVCALMLASLGWLAATTPLPQPYDLLRFIDETAMTVFAAGLAHTLTRSFDAYEAAIAKRRAVLERLHERRQALTLAIYEQLEPLADRLVEAAPHAGAAAPHRARFRATLGQLTEHLNRARALAEPDERDALAVGDPDRLIRRGTMRVWLRLGAALMLFFVVRNLLAGAPFVPSLVSLGSCVLFDVWLSRPESDRRLEATALAIGLCATVPMIVHIQAYGATPDAPPLVVTPVIVLFTALLSQGPATWAIVAANLGVLAWTAWGRELSLLQSRLLSDLALSFLVVILALGRVFALRRRYVEALLAQGRRLAEALRQHRRLAGTLFHDVNNYLLVLHFHADLDDAGGDLPNARSLSSRVQRLIALSKDFLLGPGPTPPLTSIAVRDALGLLQEAFASRMADKQVELAIGPGMELCVRAHPELLVECVLGNLLSNAVKFSPRGATVTFSAERVGSEVRILVCDRGPGLPADVLRSLDEDGPAPSHVGTAGERGQGYGLQLAHEHLQRMDGRLELTPRPDGGTQAAACLSAVS